MYSRSVTANQIQLASEVLGYKLKQRSIDEVQFFNSHLKSLTEFNDKGEAINWRKEMRPGGLKSDEIRYIENERTVCKLDFLYWATHYAYINDYEKNLVLFNPNKTQLAKLNLWSESEEKGHAIEELNLKARRLGISTLVELAVAHRIAFHSASTALVASSDPSKSRDMADIIRLVYDMMPWWLLPKRTTGRTGELYEFFELKSKIMVRWGNQDAGLGRGGTPNLTHLSEMPDFDDPYEKIDGALLKAIIPTAKVLTQFESTAKGKGNWLHSNWEDAKAYWPNCRLRPIFFPWFVGDDIYPHPDWLSLHPIPLDWYPLQITVDHATTARRFVRNWDLLRKILGAKWEMSRQQMWYWEFNRKEAERKKTPEGKSMLTVFLEEMPGDDIEAFQVPHSNIFDPELIYEIKGRFTDPEVFEVRGPEDEISGFQHYFPADYQKGAQGENIDPIIVRPTWTDSLPSVTYQLIPLKFQGYSNLSPIGKLIIWEMPDEKEEYGLGVDPSYGKGKDLSAIEVIRKRTMDRREAQVAEFVSPHLDAHLLWPYVFVIADLYSTIKNGTKTQARVAIEFAANGQTVYHEMKDRGWWHFHQRVPDDAKTIDYSREYRSGFEMTRKSRPKVTQGLERNIRDKTFTINSPWLLEECGSLIWNADKERLEAGYGAHDDRFMAAGIIRESFYQTETPGMRVAAHQQKTEREQRANHHPTFQLPDQMRDTPSPWFEDHEHLMVGIKD